MVIVVKVVAVNNSWKEAEKVIKKYTKTTPLMLLKKLMVILVCPFLFCR